MKYDIELSRAAEGHLDDLSAYDRKVVIDAMEKHLSYQPMKPTRNRKQMRSNPMATWELRIGKFRVLYNVVEDQVIVVVVALAVKEGNKFIIGGEEYDL